MKRFIVFFVVLGIILSGVLWYNLRKQTAISERPPGSSGIIESTKVTISSRLMAKILQMQRKEGERVKQGDTLALLDCTDFDAQLLAAQARLETTKAQWDAARAQVGVAKYQAKAARQQAIGQFAQAGSVSVQGKKAKKDSERAKKLQQDKVLDEVSVENIQSQSEDLAQRVSAAEATARAAEASANAAETQTEALGSQVSAASLQLKVIQAEIKRAQAALDDCTIKAPRNGIITIKAHEAGELALPGTALYELSDDTEKWVKFYITNAQLGKVQVRQEVKIVADSFPEKTFSGVIEWISQEAEFTPRIVQTRSDRDRLVYAVQAKITSQAALLRNGMPVDCEIVENLP